MSKERAAVDAFKKSYGNSVGTVEEKRKLRKKAWETFKDEIQKEEARPNKKKRKSSRKRVKMPNELREAVQNGDIAATERLLNDNSQWTNSTTDEGYTVLHLAALFGQFDTIKRISHKLANTIDWVSKNGSTALHYACLGRHAGIVHRLAQLGADRLIENSLGQRCQDLDFDELNKKGEKEMLVEQEEEQRRRTTSSKKYPTPQMSDATLHRLRKVYLDAWEKLIACPPVQICFKDIPWPTGREGNRFMLRRLDSQEISQLLREEQKRWHPDKFKQRFGARLASDESNRILECVVECAQWANAERNQREAEHDTKGTS